jgi:hypothetical protein
VRERPIDVASRWIRQGTSQVLVIARVRRVNDVTHRRLSTKCVLDYARELFKSIARAQLALYEYSPHLRTAGGS